MERQEILAVTDSDAKGCAAINKLVHEKLGLCWHEWAQLPPYPHPVTMLTKWECRKCKETKGPARFRKGDFPDYTHDIKAAWAIKAWLDKQPLGAAPHAMTLYQILRSRSTLGLVFSPDSIWSSPLDRCKAFLVMDL